MNWNYSKPPMDGSPILAVFSTKTGWDYYPCIFDEETQTLCWYEDGGPIGYAVDEMRGWVAITPPTPV